ncbi:MAG: ureE [Labilithrix sp.]|nr:ureE [Labilithrix sp.]
MLLIESVLGNVRDPEWKARIDGAAVDRLRLDQWEAQKNRLRKMTEGGLELALSLDRHVYLHDGDVLLFDASSRRVVLAALDLSEVMVVDLAELEEQSPSEIISVAVELGHALGNQHWPAVVKGTKVFVPLAVDRKVMASVMKSHALPRVRYEFMPGADVIPFLAPHEARRLFGGAEVAAHSHPHEHR